MGPAVVHGIIASHGGAITVQSRFEEGTTFVIYLPQIDVEIDRDRTDDDDLPHGKESILFVDDEEILTLLMQEMLKQLGYNVEVRTSSVEALAAFRSAPDRRLSLPTNHAHHAGRCLGEEPAPSALTFRSFSVRTQTGAEKSHGAWV